MSGKPAEGPRGGSPLTLALLLFAFAVFGLVGGLPFLLGPVVGVAAAVLSAIWRRRRTPTAVTYGIVPALVGAAVLSVTAAPVPATELFGGLTALALLLWVADDPHRPSGGGRRAVPALAACGLGFGVAWVVSLALPTPAREVGVAGGLLALALLAIALLFDRESRRSLPDASA